MKKFLTLSLVVLMLVVSATNIVKAQDDEPERIGWWEECPEPVALPTEVPLGLNLGLTGATSLYGIPQQQGAELALAEVNATGYLGAAQLVGYLEDGGSTSEEAIAAMEKLISEDHVVGIIGPTFSAQAFAADPIAQEAGIPVMGVSTLATGITDIGEFVFRDSLLDQVQIPAAVNAVVDLAQIESAAIIYSDNNEFTVTGYEVFRDTLEGLEIDITNEETFETGDVDFNAQITNIIANDPDAVMISALGAEALPLLTQFRSLGYEGIIVGGNGLNAPALLADSNAEKVIIGAAWHISNESPINQAFVTNFENQYGFLPDQFAAQAYTAVWLYATAIRCGDSADPATIRDQLAAIQAFNSPLGLFSFDENRDPIHDPVVQIIVDGKFELLTAENIGQ